MNTIFIVRKTGMTFLGTALMALGIKSIVASGRGADALSTLILGVQQHVNVRFGTLSMLFSVLILLAMFFKKRELLGIGSIINSFGVGLFLNLFDYLFTFPTVETWLAQLGYSVVGTLGFGIGTACYIIANFGIGSYDCLMLLIQEKLGCSTKVARILLDGFLIGTGVILGAPFGFGTIIVLGLLGPTIEETIKIFFKQIEEEKYKLNK